MTWALLVAVSLGTPMPPQDVIPSLPQRPERPVTLPRAEHQCPSSLPLRVGDPLPAGVLSDAGVLLCSAVLVPTSTVGDLLSLEVYADGLEAWASVAESRHRYDVSALQRDLTWTRARIDQLEEPPPLLQRPGAQRLIGRLETLATVAAIGGVVYGVTYRE